MNRLILSSVAVAALTLSSVATVSAQLSPEQRSAVRIIIVEQLTDEMQNRLPDRIAEAAAGLSTLTPEQRAKIGSAIKARLGDDVREGLPERLSEALADRLGKTVQGPREAKLTPEQRTAIRNLIRDDKINQMVSAMQTGAAKGMVLMQKSIQDLVDKGIINKEAAIESAFQRELFEEPETT
jgi:ribosomal protein S20